MTVNPTIPATAAEDERSGYENRLGQTRSGTPRLVPVPPPPVEAATFADSNRRATSQHFSWHLIDPLRDGFELRMDAADRPLARLTIGGIGIPSARLDVSGQRLVFTTNELGNPQVTITEASTRAVVAKFEWQRPGRQGTLRFVEGGQLRWRRTSRWRRTFTVADRFGNLLLRFYPDGRALTYSLKTLLEPSGGSRDDLTLLLALGWFLQISIGAATPPDPVTIPRPCRGDHRCLVRTPR
jgi:hypothetical protein